MSTTLNKENWQSFLDEHKPCSRCGYKYRPRYGIKVVLCRDCRSTMTPTEVKKWTQS